MLPFWLQREGGALSSIRPAARTAPSRPDHTDPRTESGERRINLPADLQATRVSERFRLPDEALPSEPPPAPLGDGDEIPAVGTATAHIPIPERIKLLNAAIPTPHAFAPAPVVVPASPAPPRIEPAAPSDEPLEAPAASERPAARTGGHPARRRHVLNALALFVILLGGAAIALRLCASFLFE